MSFRTPNSRKKASFQSPHSSSSATLSGGKKTIPDYIQPPLYSNWFSFKHHKFLGKHLWEKGWFEIVQLKESKRISKSLSSKSTKENPQHALLYFIKENTKAQWILYVSSITKLFRHNHNYERLDIHYNQEESNELCLRTLNKNVCDIFTQTLLRVWSSETQIPQSLSTKNELGNVPLASIKPKKKYSDIKAKVDSNNHPPLSKKLLLNRSETPSERPLSRLSNVSAVFTPRSDLEFSVSKADSARLRWSEVELTQHSQSVNRSSLKREFEENEENGENVSFAIEEEKPSSIQSETLRFLQRDPSPQIHPLTDKEVEKIDQETTEISKTETEASVFNNSVSIQNDNQSKPQGQEQSQNKLFNQESLIKTHEFTTPDKSVFKEIEIKKPSQMGLEQRRIQMIRQSPSQHSYMEPYHHEPIDDQARRMKENQERERKKKWYHKCLSCKCFKSHGGELMIK